MTCNIGTHDVHALNGLMQFKNNSFLFKLKKLDSLIWLV